MVGVGIQPNRVGRDRLRRPLRLRLLPSALAIRIRRCHPQEVILIADRRCVRRRSGTRRRPGDRDPIRLVLVATLPGPRRADDSAVGITQRRCQPCSILRLARRERHSTILSHVGHRHRQRSRRGQPAVGGLHSHHIGVVPPRISRCFEIGRGSELHDARRPSDQQVLPVGAQQRPDDFGPFRITRIEPGDFAGMPLSDTFAGRSRSDHRGFVDIGDGDRHFEPVIDPCVGIAMGVFAIRCLNRDVVGVPARRFPIGRVFRPLEPQHPVRIDLEEPVIGARQRPRHPLFLLGVVGAVVGDRGCAVLGEVLGRRPCDVRWLVDVGDGHRQRRRSRHIVRVGCDDSDFMRSVHLEIKCGIELDFGFCVVRYAKQRSVGSSQRERQRIMVEVLRADTGDDNAGCSAFSDADGVGVLRKGRRLLRRNPQDLIVAETVRGGDVQSPVGSQYRRSKTRI